jgi:hypothetical protein
MKLNIKNEDREMNNLISLHGEQYHIVAKHCYNENQNQPVLEIFDAETGEPGGVISQCIPGVKLNQDETILKPLLVADIVEALEVAGIATRTPRVIHSGYGHYPVVKMNSSFMAMFGKKCC